MKNYRAVARELMVIERTAWWNPRVRRILKAAPLVVMFLLLNNRAARAACSFSPTPDPTADGSRNSLRHAIQAANASGQNCTIELAAGTYTLTIKNTDGHVDDASSGGLDITDSGHTVTIDGKGAGVSIVNANAIDRVFEVVKGNAAFSNLTIEGGVAQDNGSVGVLPGTTASEGGGVLIFGGGHVTFSQVSIQGNQALGANGRYGTLASPNGTPGHAARGGGLFVYNGAVTLTGSKVTGNAATGGYGGGGYSDFCNPGISQCHSGAGGAGGAATGGGLYVLSGSVGMLTSTVSADNATGGEGGDGGGVVWSSNEEELFRSGGNGGAAQGAGLFVSADSLSLRQSTVSENSAIGGRAGPGGYTPKEFAPSGSSQGGGIFVTSGDISLSNSTIFANTAQGGSGLSGRFADCGRGGNASGGGLYLTSGSVSATGVTTASNQALAAGSCETGSSEIGSSYGGGIANAGAGLFINTTLIGNNDLATLIAGEKHPVSASNGYDVYGAITSTYSLISEKAGATITDDGGNHFDVNPLLDPAGLGSNGGPTQTVALEEDSPADGTGDNTICKEAAPSGLGGIDQRGFPRFRPGDELCDIGAFEFVTLLVQPFQPASLSFGSETVDHETPAQKVSVTNNQTSSVTLSKSIGGADAADFTIVSTTCGTSVAANTSCTISVAFKPVATGTRTAVLTVSDSPDSTSPYTVKLVGVGT
jgi:hypothetical protein